MIKGVNKQILEVTNTDNPYFERIIFFVKPEYKNEDRALLEREAQTISKRAKKPPRIRRSKKQMLAIAMRCSLCVLAGVAITFLLNVFI